VNHSRSDHPLRLGAFTEEDFLDENPERPDITLYVYLSRLYVYDDHSHWREDVSLISQVACLGCDENDTLETKARCWRHIKGPQEIPLGGRGKILRAYSGPAPLALNIDLLMINTDNKCDEINDLLTAATETERYRKRGRDLAGLGSDLVRLLASGSRAVGLIREAYSIIVEAFGPSPFIGQDSAGFSLHFDDLGAGRFPADGSLRRCGDFGYSLEILVQER
jgi:hypothetical protein